MHKKKPKISKKKVTELSPQDYNFVGDHHGFMGLSPSHHGKSTTPSMSHRLEKWILLTLLALAMAAFTGFKLLENSDMAFSINDSSPKQANSTNSLGSEEEFKAAFKQNREEARALVHSKTNAVKKVSVSKRSSKKLFAKKTSKVSRGVKKFAKATKKKTIAKR